MTILSVKWSYIFGITKHQAENYFYGQPEVSLIIRLQFELQIFADLVSRDCLIPVFLVIFSGNCGVLIIKS
jgi:hypothetical protein